jgi:hypothetical protein
MADITGALVCDERSRMTLTGKPQELTGVYRAGVITTLPIRKIRKSTNAGAKLARQELVQGVWC